MNLLRLFFVEAWKDRGFLLRGICVCLSEESILFSIGGEETIILLALKSADMNTYPFPSLVCEHLKFD